MALEDQESPFKDDIDRTLDHIAWCESRGDMKAKNPTSSASGKFQFLRGSWEYYGQKLWGNVWLTKDIFSEKDQDELAHFVVALNGYSDWSESISCWGQ